MFKEDIKSFRRNGSHWIVTELRFMGILFFKRTEEL